MNNSFNDISASQLRHAADLKEKIDTLQGELETILGGASAPGPKLIRKGRTMSAAARARIAAGARARWARIKAKTPSKPAAQTGRKMTASARARLAAIARARWKKVKAAGRSAL